MLAVVTVLWGFVMVSPRKKHPEKDTPVLNSWGEKPHSLGSYGNFSRRWKTLILNLLFGEESLIALDCMATFLGEGKL
jgi:hypothetical protein